MRLPTFVAGTAPPRETGLVRADPRALTDTGDAEFRAIAGAGRAIGGAGELLGNAAIKRKNLDNEAAAGRADARSIDALTEATNAINGQDFSQNTVLPDDPKKYYSGETGDILEFTTEDKIKGREEQIGIVNGRLETLSKAMGFRGEKARLAWLEGKKDLARETLTKVSNAKQSEYQTELFLGNARNAAANGDMEVSEQWIELAEKSGLIGPKLAASEREKNAKLSVETQAIELYRAGNFDAARELVEKSELSIQDKESMSITIGVAERRAKKERDKDDREKQSALYAREDAGEILKREDFEIAWQDPEKADQHFDEYQVGLVAEAKGEVNFIKKGDPIVLARTEAIIDLNPMSITEAQLYENATRGIGTENITGLVDRLRKAKKGFYAPITKYNTQFSTLLNAKYFGEKDEIETSDRYLEMKRKMSEFIDSQKPSEQVADAFFSGLITKNFTGFRRGGFEEKGFKHTFTDSDGNEVTQRFRFGDIRTRKIANKTVSEFYAGTNDDGEPLWLPRR